MSRAELDYRFGWRWLLPDAGARSLRTAGLTDEEEVFLRTELRLGVGDDAWIVDADRAPARGVTARLLAARWVCAVGRGPAVERWRALLAPVLTNVRTYALLPASAPRVVVPLGDPRDAAAGLALHRPGRRMARYAVGAARALLSLGVTAPLRGRVLLVAQRGASSAIGARGCGLGERLPPHRGDFALYLGTPDERRKTIVLPVVRGVAPAVVKIAEAAPARHALAREAEALHDLAECGRLAERVPRCLAVHEGGGALAVYQEYRPRIPTSARRIDAAAVEFLAALSTVERREVPLEAELEGLSDRGDAPGAVVDRLRLLASRGACLWRWRAHGDFAPWNCAWTHGGLFVYDWEASDPRGDAFGDAFYFRLGPARHVRTGARPTALFDAALDFAGRVQRCSGVRQADPVLHLAVWLLKQRIADPAPLYSSLLEILAERWRPTLA